MKNIPVYKRLIHCVAGAATLMLAANYSYAQVIAYDVSTNGNFSTGNGGGYGFGTWTLATPGGGNYVGADGGITYFGLWNNALLPGNYSRATRSFDASLSVGEAFSTSFKNGNLNNSGAAQQAGFRLLDSGGNVLFSFWQQGGNNVNGNYFDANGAGTATGFDYHFNELNGYEFVLNSATSYTFIDLYNSAMIVGTISGTIDQVQYFRENPSSYTGGQGGTDFRFYDMQISTVPEPASIAIAGLGGLGLWWLARRRSV